MNMLIYLIPIALFMGGVGLAAFLWSLGNGQYDDLQGAAWRVLADDESDPPKS
ncbi:cbb3-type cytochrome oxidase assembly protein CcoS [Rhizobium leguminosarum]|uniref:cbb3-type cytochrome oxidase assembly protein CcoS n=1 Tax=Rhizobium leguminosarum TaxID=384 RepID=UPI001AE7E866|nr:cbb3-type cytochrome oxidase assembly protein CcoS [Rhizobium leguminosarum]MBP2445137.1 cbb3-type cytochrome oxidase maturation protein [Rhizobium leguminosarum]